MLSLKLQNPVSLKGHQSTNSPNLLLYVYLWRSIECSMYDW